MKKQRVFLAGVAALAILSSGNLPAAQATVATATSSPAQQLQAQIDKQLKDHPEGSQVGSNEVSYNDGKVIMVFPDPETGVVPTSTLKRPETPDSDTAPGTATPQTSYYHGCPYGLSTRWYCFYQDASWGGRMLEFQDCASGGTVQYFSNYGFENQTSSWVNTRNNNHGFINVNDYNYNLWNEWTGSTISSSSYVGDAANDKADYFICYG